MHGKLNGFRVALTGGDPLRGDSLLGGIAVFVVFVGQQKGGGRLRLALGVLGHIDPLGGLSENFYFRARRGLDDLAHHLRWILYDLLRPDIFLIGGDFDGLRFFCGLGSQIAQLRLLLANLDRGVFLRLGDLVGESFEGVFLGLALAFEYLHSGAVA